MKVVLEEKFLTLEHYPEGNYIVELWSGFTTDKQFMDLLDKIIIACEAKGAKGVIIDARNHKGLSPAMQKHAADVMQKYALKIGSFKQAIMVPKDIFSKLSVNNYSKEMEKNKDVVDSKFFEDLDEAKKWMEGSAVTA